MDEIFSKILAEGSTWSREDKLERNCVYQYLYLTRAPLLLDPKDGLFAQITQRLTEAAFQSRILHLHRNDLLARKAQITQGLSEAQAQTILPLALGTIDREIKSDRFDQCWTSLDVANQEIAESANLLEGWYVAANGSPEGFEYVLQNYYRTPGS